MHLLLPLLAMSAPLEPAIMAQKICEAESIGVDSDACLQTTFDKLAEAETNALVYARTSTEMTEETMLYIRETAGAMIWAFEHMIEALDRNGPAVVKWYSW
jgi:hypothetical protein